MIRIGAAARQELIAWIDNHGAGRVHVPVWSAHELYRHHVEQTIPAEIGQALDQLEAAAQRSFKLIWPLLSEPLAGAASAQAQRTEARDALRSVRGVIAHARSWSPSYARHAAEVIAFANRHAVQNSDVFTPMHSIERVATARFTGRIPPAFRIGTSPRS